MKNIEFTKEQFEALLKLAYIGEWVVNAHRLPDEHVQKFRDLESHLYSHASHYGLDDLVIIDSDSGKTYPSRNLEFDKEIRTYIDEYDNENFWSDLCSRLAERDAVRVHGREKFFAMDPFERMKILSDLEEYYQDKFAIEGLDNF